ncbi:MAG TPA: 30S ribosomal protein S1 [Candidatus Micrarchaeia archaeon]|nr:30S ribosomal protein S1 [Candidatus Micrarchaeia archaeon]
MSLDESRSNGQNPQVYASMEEYLRIGADTIRTLTYGDIVDGTVVRVDPDEVLVDIGAKSEGVISNRELAGRAEEPVVLRPGDQIKVYVLQSENDDGNVVLSLRRARAEGIWAKAAEKESSGEGVEAEVREQNKGGLIVNIMGLRGFLPSSQVARAHSGNLLELVGQRIMVKILEVNRKRNRLIVSQRAAQDEDRARQREELFERLHVGDVVSGRVSGLTSYGGFVNLGGADGLIHISELAWDRVSNVSDMLAVGDEVTVKVIKLDPELSRISLSLRQMSEDPWDTIEARFPTGAIIEGTVTKTKKYGAFLQIADGVEGLLHISELSWEHVERTEDVLRVGDVVKVLVLQADRTRRRISLSLRQLFPRPADLPPEPDGGERGYDAAADYVPEDDDDARASGRRRPAAGPSPGAAALAAAEALPATDPAVERAPEDAVTGAGAPVAVAPVEDALASDPAVEVAPEDAATGAGAPVAVAPVEDPLASDPAVEVAPEDAATGAEAPVEVAPVEDALATDPALEEAATDAGRSEPPTDERGGVADLPADGEGERSAPDDGTPGAATEP